MKVIDVSDWNNNIDWSNVTYAGVEGVLSKSVRAGLYERH